jgi:hypothetical protein
LEGKTFPPDFDLAMFWGGEDVTPTVDLSEVVVRLKAEMEWQHNHLVGVLGQRK